jgi:hypothetical protein
MRDEMLLTGQAADAGDSAGQVVTTGWSVPGYTAVTALGSGGFGDVVLARHDESGTQVAIKYLRRELLADERFAQMFRAEAAVLATMDDPHVVRLHEYVEGPGGAAIVMELVDGVSLRQILARQGGTTPEAALVVLQGSLLGLAAAHARGVVHRDYKPDNVLVDGDGASKLTDFGIAARTGDTTATGGTLAYAPPEQFDGRPASPAGDVYAATATFFECLTGQPPFRGDTAAALMYQHLSQPVPVEAVPEPVRPLVAAGMAKQPGDRPADAAAFAAALSQVAAQAYGPRWYQRGRSHLGEAALLLAAMWPSGGLPAVQGTTVQQIPLRQRHLRSRLRHASAAKKTIAAGIVVAVAGAGAYSAIRVTRSSYPVTLPVITGVSPASGGTAGGSTVRITGTGLDGATVVRFGAAPGTITADSATQITVTSPPSTSTAAGTAGSPAPATATGAGIVDVTVTTPGGTSHHTAADHYTYTASQPAITRVSPDGGGTSGGTTVTVTGTGLAGATAVRFGSAAATITADSATQITVTSPPGTGRVDITVATPAGTSPASQGHYSYTDQPRPTQSISFAVPASATAGGSAALSATGGGSGNPVVFTVDPSSGPGVCAVSGSTVTYAAIGSCVIDANQAGNGQYADAPQVQHAITVTGLTQAVSLSAPAQGYVHDSGHLAATGGASGNPVVLSASGGVCAVSGTTVTYIAQGSCVIVANQAGNGRYSDAPQVRRTITVKKRPQSISFSAPATGALWSSALLSATGGASGNPVVFTSATPAVCHVSVDTVTYTETGTCIIDANQAGNDTYADAPQVQRRITVIRVLQYRGISSSASGSAG